MVCGVKQNLHVFNLHRNPDLDDRVFDCSLTSMAAAQAQDVHASDHDREWLGSTATNRHGVEAFDFATVSG